MLFNNNNTFVRLAFFHHYIRLIVYMACLSCANVLAETSSAEISTSNQQDNIASNKYWLNLLHYKYSWLTFGYVSDITDPAFFLSENGRRNPLDELQATIRAFRTDPGSACRFPARYFWLTQKFNDVFKLPLDLLATCSEFQQWMDTINPGSATLVFPAAYLNSPSSMFGHTLLRIEPADERKDLPLISYAINYAANVGQADNNFAFAIKGIFGGYPGIMSIVPYHEKITEYSDIETRDIWEYQLNLDRNELQQLMRHTWELRELNSAYYFFTANCSYLILNLLESAREGIDLTSQFHVKAIPVDTVRAVVDAELVNNTLFRASAATQLYQHYELVTPAGKLMVKDIVAAKPDLADINISELPEREQARILEIAFDTLRYQANKTATRRDVNSSYNHQLLSARSRINVADLWPEINAPEFKSEQGHRSSRLMAGVRTNENDEDDLLIRIRPAYHDQLDPPRGYPHGAQINFLDVTLAHNGRDDNTRIEKLTFIDIFSLTPDHDLFDPLSWRVDFSYNKLHANGVNLDVLQVSPGFGKTYELVGSLLGYALLNANIEYSDDYDDNYAVGTGLQLGTIVYSSEYSASIDLRSTRLFSGQTDTRFVADMGVAWHVETNFSMRLNLQRQKLFDNYRNSQILALNWYF